MKKNLLFISIAITLTALLFCETLLAQSWNITGNSNIEATSKLGTTNNRSLRFYTNNIQRMIINSAEGYIGIGTPTPVNILTVQSSGGTPAASWLNGLNTPVYMGFAEGVSSEFVLAAANNEPGRRAVIQGRRSRGTLASPSRVAPNDYLASFLASGYDGSTFQNPATIDFYVDSTPYQGNIPARISFVTGSNAGNRKERLRVGSTGDVSISTGNLIISSAEKTIQFAIPSAASVPMITMFPAGTTNGDRMVIGHSPFYPSWGLQYQDNADKFNFLSAGLPVLTADLSARAVGIGTSSPANRLHVRQSVANKAIEWQHEAYNDYWTVGIGTNTLNCRFEFNGLLRGSISSVDGSFINGSDIRLKEQIEDLPKLLDKIMQLKPSAYYYKDSRKLAKHKSLGFIAQEVEKIFPEIVYDSDDGYKGLSYSAFAVVAIKAIQEQQNTIVHQQESIAGQQETIVNLEDRITKLEAAIKALIGNTESLSGVFLEQNSPNPFRESTTFYYKIPSGSQGLIKIYDISGKMVKSMVAPAGGYARLSGNSLSAGSYVYSLIVDGKTVSSKKMVLLK